jgi:tRNA(fMet)-specific endonuclease VapC
VRYLFDTDTCSWLIHRRPGHEGILERCDGKRYGDIVISAISFAELQFMAANSMNAAAKRGAIARFLLNFRIEAFDGEAARAYGDVRLALRRVPIGALDTLIASHALSLDATVVTGNLRHFSRVPGLRAENWIRRPAGWLDK